MVVRKNLSIPRKINSSTVRFKSYEHVLEEKTKHQIKLILN